MDATLLAPLLTPSGWALLETLPPYDERQALTLGERLRAEGHSPELVAAALTQQRLRGRAAAKFGPFASQMLFTPDGLEQLLAGIGEPLAERRQLRGDVVRAAGQGLVGVLATQMWHHYFIDGSLAALPSYEMPQRLVA